MRISVVPVDKVIVVDGNGVTADEWKFDDSHIHAIQWFHDKGHIELKTNEPNIEIDDISVIQPYIDKYMEMISSIEQHILLEQEKERKRIQAEEEEKIFYEQKKKQEDEEVQKIIDQNKEIRKEKARLELEQSLMLEEMHNKQKYYDIQLEKKELEKQAEIESLKSKELNEIIKQKDSELVQKYENLLNDLETQKHAILKETESYVEATKRKEALIEFEKKSLEAQRAHFHEEMVQKRKLLEKEREQLDDMQHKMTLEQNYKEMMLSSLRESVQLEADHVKKLKDLQQKEIEQANLNYQLAIKELEKRQQSLEYSNQEVKFKKDQLDKDTHEAIAEVERRRRLIEEFDKSVGESVELAKYNINDQLRDNSISELISNKPSEEVNVERLSEILNELDPEKVYTSLTSGEVDENNFPVEKAIVWFSALKKVIDEKSQN